MLGFIVLLAAFIFAVVAPLMALRKFYHPSQLNIWQNIFWILVTIITWPLVPIVMAARKSDKLILSVFWGSFLVMGVSGWYWSVLNINTLLHLQQQYLMDVRL